MIIREPSAGGGGAGAMSAPQERSAKQVCKWGFKYIYSKVFMCEIISAKLSVLINSYAFLCAYIKKSSKLPLNYLKNVKQTFDILVMHDFNNIMLCIWHFQKKVKFIYVASLSISCNKVLHNKRQ